MVVQSYNANDWHLFWDSSKGSFKCVCFCIMIIYMAWYQLGTQQNLNLIKYREHKWTICVDLKIVHFLLGQRGYIKYRCILCLWDSRVKEEHYFKQIWPSWTLLTFEEKHIINPRLVSKDKIIFPTSAYQSRPSLINM